MLKEESIWISNSLQKLDVKDISPLLNIGSSTAHFREVEQAFIHENIFKLIQAKGVVVVHTDLQEDAGVELVGNLMDDDFIKVLKARKFNSIICSNLFEHLEENTRMEVCKVLCDILNEKGFLLLTVPYIYPYHEDPIDTWYRPNLKSLANCFPSFEIIEKSYVRSNLSYFDELKVRPKNLIMSIIKLLIPFYKHKQWLNDIKYFPFWFSKYQVSCILLRKI